MSADKDDNRTVEGESKRHWTVFALQYEGSAENTAWSVPENVRECQGMVWPEGCGWSCFVLLTFRSAVDEAVPRAMKRNGVAPTVESPDDRGEAFFVDFWCLFMYTSFSRVTRFSYPRKL